MFYQNKKQEVTEIGFLRTKPSGSSAELPAGVTDVMAALRWVKDNIGSFGGDPKRITLLGHDTGAAIANLLLISPQAKGLFNRVCLLSGSLLSPWAVVLDPGGLRDGVASQVGCGGDADLASCLQKTPLRTLLGVRPVAPRFLPPVAPWAPGPANDPAAAVENAGEPFLSTRLLLTTTTTESYLDFNNQDIQYGIEEDQRNRVLRTYVRNAYVYHLNEIFSTVRNEYTNWEKPIQHPINIRDSTLEALSDGHTVAPLLRLGYLHARRGAPTYFCHFNYQTKESDYPQRLGSVRGEDVNYFLGLPLVGGQPFFPQNYTLQDIRVAETVLNFFTNFAKSGDPNEPRKAVDVGMSGGHSAAALKDKGRHRANGFYWDLYEPSSQLYLSLSLKPRMKSHYRGHKMAIWLNLIPQLHQPGEQDVSMRHHHFHERANHYYAVQLQSITRNRSRLKMASKRRNMFYDNEKQETTEIGTIRAESFTRIPPTQSTSVPSEPLQCPPNTTSDRPLGLSEFDHEDVEEQEASLLEKHYNNYSAALGVTVGVGCLLLALNALIFSAIYYQRRKRWKRTSSSDEEPELAGGPPKQSPCLELQSPLHAAAAQKRQPPVPPVRTSSNPPQGQPSTVKKRVQIQEISV